MDIIWGNEHANLLSSLLRKLEICGVKYFILRNYQGLPDINPSKDVDIIFEPGKMKIAREKIIETFREHKIQYYKEELFGHIHSFWGVKVDTAFSIHIDLIEGYYSKGYAVFTFDELYEHVIPHKTFYVLDDLYSGIMIYVYKQFGYKYPKLKEEYKEELFDVYSKNKVAFLDVISEITSKKFSTKVGKYIESRDFDCLLNDSRDLNRILRKYVWRKRPISTLVHVIEFVFQRLDHFLFRYRSYSCNFAVLAPDGTGKTTFLDSLIDKLNYYRVCRMEDNHISVYHFRPNIFPNLGAVGEKAGLKKQDKDFTNPHRNRPANKISSLFRVMYYTLDYIIGWQLVVRKDAKENKWSIFDRYSYDLIVDPLRTRLSLSKYIRTIFVKLTPKPNIVFCLLTDAKTVYERKQELELHEIERQLEEYKNLALKDKKRFYVLDAAKTPDELSNEALIILFNKYMKKL